MALIHHSSRGGCADCGHLYGAYHRDGPCAACGCPRFRDGVGPAWGWVLLVIGLVVLAATLSSLLG